MFLPKIGGTVITDATSVADLFLRRVADTPDAGAFSFPSGSEWKRLTWKDVGARVRAIACGLRSLGLENEQRCAILSGTRIEWILADFGILCAAGATTTVYPSNTAEETAYILKDSDTVMVFAENEDQLKKLRSHKDELPKLKKVILFDGKASDDGWAITLDELEKQGAEHDKKDPAAYEKIAKGPTKESLATLIYTSGTTGQPKGVELTHDCWLYTGEGIEGLGILKPSDTQYLWLPLAHAFGKVLEVAQVRIGFFTAVDGRVDKLMENLGVVKPTFVCAVPRIFEKVHNKVVGGAKEGGGMKWKIFQWAVKVGKEVSKVRQAGQEPGGFLGFKFSIANKLVFSKLKQRLGGNLRCFVSGAAPLSRELAEFFHAFDILILEGYGMTESSAASFVARQEKYRFGTVGMPLPGTQVKIADGDGEILIKSRGVMRGYHNLQEATKETLDGDGWLHTGDIGEVDKDGFLKITDRKKDLIKTSGGKYVAPQMIEGKLKAICPLVSQVVVHGDNRNYCTALLTLDEESIKKWAKENGMGDKSYADLAGSKEAHALVQPFVEQLNKELPSYEQLKKFELLPSDFTLEAGELTASLKVKRKVVEKKYKGVLDAMYAGGGKQAEA
jgi:long-chain acyl-CoA synthetase